MIDHSLVTGFTMFIRRSFDMTCFGISTYHRHEPPLRAVLTSGRRAGTRIETEVPKITAVGCFLAPRSDRGAQTTKRRPRRDTPSCATPAPTLPNINFGELRARSLSGTEKCLCSSVERNDSSSPEPR